MKRLNRIIIALMLAAAMLFTACAKDAPKEEKPVEQTENKEEQKEEKKDEAKEDKKEEKKEEKTEEQKKKEQEERMAARTKYIETTKNAYSEEYTELEHADSAEMGGAPVDFTVQTLDEGKDVKLDQILASGELVQLNFFQTWCSFCIKEMPDLVELNKRDDIKVVLIDSGEKASAVKTLIEGQQIDLPIFVNEDGSVNKAYNIASFPSNYYIKDGKIVGQLFGAWNEKVLNFVADELNAGNPMPEVDKLQEVWQQGEDEKAGK